MKKSLSFTFLFSVLMSLTLVACSKDKDDKDLEKPVIEAGSETLPQSCQVYTKGEEIPFRCIFTDNEGLGNYNIEIHNNFEHHSHSTDAGDCALDAKKDPVNPWVYNKDFTIPGSPLRYDAQVDIPIPADIDPGDYHFMVRVTDKAGWQELRAVSIKILEKE
ncbi:DUF4625 domain-containing protein [uncultured Parabacteroides sp.]|uniref:DUF4625 domain-containing protein n=1 Tax=uncultured Parabacteroides sp. TaxID=512312 RepID=UPI0025FA48CC|nr:DUF4625 domain-containing protein [uncultured Parabacteroides sp.]